MDTTHCGSCLCGKIRLEAIGAPQSVVACHCTSCRKQTGAPAAVYVDYLKANVRFTGPAIGIYQSSSGAKRGFCCACGSTLTYQADNLPEMIHIHIGVFDHPAGFEPTDNENTESQLTWLHITTKT